MNKTRGYAVLQLLIILGLGIFVYSRFQSRPVKNLTLEQVEEIMLTQGEGIAEMRAGTAKEVERSFGMSNTSLEFVFYRRGNGIMDVSELLIAKVASNTNSGTATQSSLQEIESGVSKRLTEQIANFTGYGTNQLDLLEHAICYSVGDYYFYAVSEKAEDWKEVFLDLVY